MLLFYVYNFLQEVSQRKPFFDPYAIGNVFQGHHSSKPGREKERRQLTPRQAEVEAELPSTKSVNLLVPHSSMGGKEFHMLLFSFLFSVSLGLMTKFSFSVSSTIVSKKFFNAFLNWNWTCTLHWLFSTSQDIQMYFHWTTNKFYTLNFKSIFNFLSSLWDFFLIHSFLIFFLIIPKSLLVKLYSFFQWNVPTMKMILPYG